MQSTIKVRDWSSDSPKRSTKAKVKKRQGQERLVFVSGCSEKQAVRLSLRQSVGLHHLYLTLKKPSKRGSFCVRGIWSDARFERAVCERGCCIAAVQTPTNLYRTRNDNRRRTLQANRRVDLGILCNLVPLNTWFHAVAFDSDTFPCHFSLGSPSNGTQVRKHAADFRFVPTTGGFIINQNKCVLRVPREGGTALNHSIQFYITSLQSWTHLTHANALLKTSKWFSWKWSVKIPTYMRNLKAGIT